MSTEDHAEIYLTHEPSCDPEVGFEIRPSNPQKGERFTDAAGTVHEFDGTDWHRLDSTDPDNCSQCHGGPDSSAPSVRLAMERLREDLLMNGTKTPRNRDIKTVLNALIRHHGGSK